MNRDTLSDKAFSNPFLTSDCDRREIWEILMTHDFQAFVAGDWSIVKDDFWEEGFCGVHAHKEADPSRWKLSFPDVESYRNEWLRQVSEFAPVQLEGTTILEFLYRSCRLDEIEVAGNRAIGRKKFDGAANTLAGKQVILRFQTLYHLIRVQDQWKITGFLGYLPNPMPICSDQGKTATPW